MTEPTPATYPERIARLRWTLRHVKATGYLDVARSMAADALYLDDEHRPGGILDEILAERARQEELVAEGKFSTSCATRDGMTDAERLAVLVEEVGEAATEVLGRARGALREELVQVAAVAVAWIEGIDAEELRDAAAAGFPVEAGREIAGGGTVTVLSGPKYTPPPFPGLDPDRGAPR